MENRSPEDHIFHIHQVSARMPAPLVVPFVSSSISHFILDQFSVLAWIYKGEILLCLGPNFQVHFVVMERNGVQLSPELLEYVDSVVVPYWNGTGPYPSIKVPIVCRFKLSLVVDNLKVSLYGNS